MKKMMMKKNSSEDDEEKKLGVNHSLYTTIDLHDPTVFILNKRSNS